MSKITPCLWFATEAEEAATFYVSLMPESQIDRVQRLMSDGPAGKAGSALMVAFTLAGRPFTALNGGTPAHFTNAVSFVISCAEQEEVDQLWAALSHRGKPQHCGWLQDRYGVAWQIVPTALPDLLSDPDPAKVQRVMQAMMGMVKLDIAALRAAAEG